MARPRCKPHRPFYFLWGNTASRASGPVVKVAAASRANTPVRKCGVKYQVSWWEQPDIPRNARIVYDTEGRVVDMVRGSLMHAARLGAGTAAVIAVLGLSGCAFNPLSTFTTPTIDQIEYETVTPAVSDDALVTPGTLTVALDTSDAPQAMQGADGELTGYAVDAARALASRMGLKVAFVDASSAGSALGDKKADIFIGEINSTDGDISSLGTCLYDAASVFGKTSDGGSLSVSTDTLNTSTLGVQMSSASQEALAKQSITANQKTYSNINECFEALESGVKKQTHSPKHSSAQTVGLFSRYTPCGHFHFRQSYNCLYLNMENPACQGTKRDFLKISFLNFLCECLAFFCNVQKTVTVADQTAVFPQHFDAGRDTCL